MIPPMKHMNINLPPEETVEGRVKAAKESELTTFTHIALTAIREAAGEDRKLDIAIIVGDPELGELILTGGCCPSCTASIIRGAWNIVRKMDDEGYVEAADEPTPTN